MIKSLIDWLKPKKFSFWDIDVMVSNSMEKDFKPLTDVSVLIQRKSNSAEYKFFVTGRQYSQLVNEKNSRAIYKNNYIQYANTLIYPK